MRTLAELVNSLFAKRWNCELTKVCLSLINQLPVDTSVFDEPNAAVGTHRHDTGVQRIAAMPYAQDILNLLYGKSMESVGHEVETFLGIDATQSVLLSIAELAELAIQGGSFILSNEKDALKIHNEIAEYFDCLATERLTDPHFKSPPEEDLKALYHLKDLLKKLATNMANIHHPDIEGKALQEALATSPAIKLIADLEKKAQENQARLTRTVTRSPYDFN